MDAKFKLHTGVTDEGKTLYFARCMPLGLSTGGCETADEAFERLKEMFAYFLDLHRRQMSLGIKKGAITP